MRTFNKSYDKLLESYGVVASSERGMRGSVAPPVHLQGTNFAAEPPPVDEEESDWTIKMLQSQKAVEELLRASQHPPDSGGLQGSDIERFEQWRKKISRLLDEFSYGEAAAEKPEDQEEVRVGNTFNDRFRHID